MKQSPWTTPQEQVWGKGDAELFHRHHGATRWPAFRQEVQRSLDHLDAARPG